MNIQIDEVGRLVTDTLGQPIPESVERRLRDRIAKARIEFAVRKPALVTRRQFGWAALAAGSVGAIIAIPLMSPQTPAAWGEIADRATELPWMQFSGNGRDGTLLQIWVSLSHGVDAMKAGDTEFAHFQSRRTRTRQWYRASEGIIRQEGYSRLPGELGSLESLLRGFSVGRKTVELVGPDEIVDQTVRKVADDGVETWEYEFTLKAVDEGHVDTYIVLIRVDPETRLPREWTRKALDGSQQLSFDVDYPPDGPRSIFDLGVPKSTKVKERS